VSIVETRYGKLKIIDTDNIISSSLRRYGEWAQHEINLLENFIQPGSVVVDAGAFIGTHARAFSSIVGPSGKVMAFEPRPATAAVLLENAKLAPTNNIDIRACALGVAEGRVTVAVLPLDENGNFGALTLDAVRNEEVAREAITITPLDAYQLDRLHFLKIDVEGMELAVLNGALETIQRCRPVVFAECNSLEASVPIIKWCEEKSYQIYGVLSPAYNQHNFVGNTENIFGEGQETGLLLIPAESCLQYENIVLQQNLPKLETADDIALLLLHKPQYPHEVLAQSVSAKNLSLTYPSPQADLFKQTIARQEAELAAFHARVNQLEHAKEHAERLAIERQDELVTLHQKLIAIEQAKDTAERMANECKVELEIIQNSLLWRVARKLNLIPAATVKENE
jgi:FkbM family methyltransferase